MEDFEKIKEISLKEAQEILPKNIAYLTMKNGDIVIVNGLDHNKFDKREKDYEDWFEEQSKQSKLKSAVKNLQTSLMKIQEDTEENERNSILQDKYINKSNNIQFNNNANNNEAQLPLKNNYSFAKNNNFNIQSLPIQKYNNNNNILYNQQNFQRRNDNSYYTGINYGNYSNNRLARENYYIDDIQNYNHLKNRSNTNQDYIINNILRPNIPFISDFNIQIRNNAGKKGINKYIRYNNHSYMEVKQ